MTETNETDEIKLRRVTLNLCELCINGEGGECHTPGCSAHPVQPGHGGTVARPAERLQRVVPRPTEQLVHVMREGLTAPAVGRQGTQLVLTDHDVRSAVSAAEDLPRNAKQLYGCLGCSAECGRCARTIKTIIDDALGACAKACCLGCPHSQAATESHIYSGFSLETAT